MWKPGQLVTIKKEVYRVVHLEKMLNNIQLSKHNNKFRKRNIYITFEGRNYRYVKDKNLKLLPICCVLVQQVFSKSSLKTGHKKL